MYFTKYDPLKERLRDRKLDDREALPYFALLSVLTAMVASFANPSGKSLDMWSAVEAIVTVLITIAGVIYCYKQNGGQSGYDFIQKSVVLGWVVGIRLVLLFLLVSMALTVLQKYLALPEEGKVWVDTVVGFLANGFYYERLGRHLRDTNNRSLAKPAEPSLGGI